MKLSQLLSGVRIDRTLGQVRLKTDELRALWEELRVKYPESFTCSKREILSWHAIEALDCEAEKRWDHAIPHLSRLIEVEPASQNLYLRRSNAYRASGDIVHATLDFATATQLKLQFDATRPGSQ